jgi:hypothetical protein
MTDEERAYQFVLAAYRRGQDITTPEGLKKLKEEYAAVSRLIAPSH